MLKRSRFVIFDKEVAVDKKEIEAVYAEANATDGCFYIFLRTKRGNKYKLPKTYKFYNEAQNAILQILSKLR